MLELKSLRKYRRQVFVNDQGKTEVRLFAGDVFYNNKLLLGDGQAGFRGIDNTLTWIDTPRRGWTFLFHNYQPFCPEYADEWFGYRDLYQGKDQTFGFKARTAGHVLGRLVANIPGVTDQNAVIYDDAFGPGMDLIIAFTFKKMLKLVRIRDGFKPAVDTDFDFQLNLPAGAGLYEKDLDTKEFIALDPTTPVQLRSKAELYIGTDQNDGQDWYTRVLPVRAWDSGTPGQGTGVKTWLCPAWIAVVGGKPYLRKRIKATDLVGTVGDVYTDATVNYYENKDTYYGTTFTTGGNPNGTNLAIGGWGDFYYSYLEWDLTGSPTSDQVSEVKVSVKWSGVAVNDSTSSWRRVTSSWTEAGVTSSSVPTDTATDAVSITNPVTTGAGNRDEKSIMTQFYNPWKAGTYSNFGLKMHSTTNNNAQHNAYSSDDADSNNHPYLVMTLVDLAYTRGTHTSLPSGTDPEETTYSSGEKTDVSTDDATRVAVSGLGGVDTLLHLYKYRHTNATDPITVNWNGQASTAPSSKTVKLQIYNFNTPGWEDLDTDSATGANTDFDLTGTISSSVANYYDDNNYIYVRVYQTTA